MKITKRKPKTASRDAKAFAQALIAALPEQCKHEEQGFCARCAKEVNEPPSTQGCEHGVEQGCCVRCAIQEGVKPFLSRTPTSAELMLMKEAGLEFADGKPLLAERPPTPEERQILKEVAHQLAGLPRMDTTKAHLENPRPLAGPLCSIGVGDHRHRYEDPRPYRGSMACADIWWPGQPPPTEKCQLANHWRDGLIRGRVLGGYAREIPSTAAQTHVKGGWGARVQGFLGA